MIGTWILESYFLIEPNGKARPIWPKSSGMLVLTESGTISATIIRQDIEQLSIQDLITYFGKFKLIGDELKIDILLSNVAWHLTKPQTRKVFFEGELLRMELHGHPYGSHIVKWKKLSP